MTSFDTSGDQFDDDCFPYYAKLTNDVAAIAKGNISIRHHVRNYVIFPSAPATASDIINWIKEYEKEKSIKYIEARVRYK
ncbi:MAG: hypothetical protein ABIB71_08685 [Candidatus Woesearchaeota archaeon]